MINKIMFSYIIEDLKEPLSYLPKGIMIGTLLISVLILLNMVWYFIKKKELLSPAKVLYIGSFTVYLFTLLQLSYFSRLPGSRNTVSLIFLETWGGSMQSKAYVIENILMMIPFGALLPTILKPARNALCCIPIGFMFSTCLEYAQFCSKRGHMQVDDVVMNTIGTLVGFIVYSFISFFQRKLLQSDF